MLPILKDEKGIFTMEVYEQVSLDMYKNYTIVITNQKTKECTTQTVGVSYAYIVVNPEKSKSHIYERAYRALHTRYEEYMVDQILLGGEDA